MLDMGKTNKLTSIIETVALYLGSLFSLQSLQLQFASVSTLCIVLDTGAAAFQLDINI